MANRIQITPATEAHVFAILDLFRRWSPDHPELANPDMLHWQRARRWVAVLGNATVGHIACLQQPFEIRGQRVEIGWAATLVLDGSAAMVQTFAGTRLLDQLTTNTGVTFAAVGVVPEIERTHERRGYIVDRTSVRMYARFFQPARALKYLGKSPALAAAVYFGNLILPVRPTRDDFGLRRIDQFDPVWDSLWQKDLSARYGGFGLRTADYLNYKLAQPRKSYQSWLYFNEPDSPAGYIIFREARHPQGRIHLVKICDLVGPDEARRVLIALAVAHARSSGADGIVALSSSLDQPVYRSAGLWVARPYPVVWSPDHSCQLQVSFFDSDLDDLW